MIQNIDSLIIVPGHASFKDSVTKLPDNISDDENWVLHEFQKGEPVYYMKHIKQGIELANDSPASLLMFSGGRTRVESGHWSEAETYKLIAENEKCVLDNERIGLELYARDSFENIQFSLYQFYKIFGRYPVHVTVVGWEFKRERFGLHARTIGIPMSKFSYIGCNNPTNLKSALLGEEKTLSEFKINPTGDKSPLSDKRKARNPFGDINPYDSYPPIILS